MLKLRHLEFTKVDAGVDTGSDPTSGSKPFSKIISDGESFDFDCEDIQRIRSEYQTLIMNIYPLYENERQIERGGKKKQYVEDERVAE